MKKSALVVLLLFVTGCGGSGPAAEPTAEGTGGSYSSGYVNPAPEKLDGSKSSEFDQDDIDRAGKASETVKEYCSDAVSEAQYVGCISHVEESDIR